MDGIKYKKGDKIKFRRLKSPGEAKSATFIGSDLGKGGVLVILDSGRGWSSPGLARRYDLPENSKFWSLNLSKMEHELDKNQVILNRVWAK